MAGVWVHGKEYENLKELSSDYDVEYQELLRLIQNGIPADDAVAQCKNARKRKTPSTLYKVNGVVYQSLSEACRRLRVCNGSVYARRKAYMQNEGLSEYEATVRALELLSAIEITRRSRGTDGVTVAGKTYPSRYAVLAAYHLSAATISARIVRSENKLTFEQAVLMGRNRQYAAAEYDSGPVELKKGQVELLQYLLDELEEESFTAELEDENRLLAKRHLVDDVAEIKLQISWITSRILNIRWLNFAGAVEEMNQINSRYAGIKLCLERPGEVVAVCDIFVTDNSTSGKKSAMAAVRQLVETGNMILAQLAVDG